MGKPGKGKSQKGKPETDWAELKTAAIRTVLTPTGKKLLSELVKRFGLSFSEFFEYLARGYLQIKWRDFTIAELVSKWDLEELAQESSLMREELEAIAKGMQPSPTAMIRLGGLLTPPLPGAKPLSTEELRQICIKTFPPKVGNGHGAKS